MSTLHSSDDRSLRWPRWWRLLVWGTSTLLLCSCSAPMQRPGPCAPPGAGTAIDTYSAGAHVAPVGVGGISLAEHGLGYPTALPLPATATGNWAPPGIAEPWPYDEYLHDGGDHPPAARVDDEWQIHGLELEDTIAHFDTLDGQRLVEPANRVDLYAPRFAAIRSVSGPVLNEQIETLEGVDAPTRSYRQDELQFAASSLQRAQARGETGRKQPSGYTTRQQDGVISTSLKAVAFQDAFLPFEDLAIIREGIFEQGEKAYLAEGLEAAVAWTHEKAVQVIIDRQAATALDGDRAAQVTYVTEPIPGKPKLRVVKVASTQFANPGDEVDFTIRFDNVVGRRGQRDHRRQFDHASRVRSRQRSSQRRRPLSDRAQLGRLARFTVGSRPPAGTRSRRHCSLPLPRPLDRNC